MDQVAGCDLNRFAGRRPVIVFIRSVEEVDGIDIIDTFGVFQNMIDLRNVNIAPERPALLIRFGRSPSEGMEEIDQFFVDVIQYAFRADLGIAHDIGADSDGRILRAQYVMAAGDQSPLVQ